MIADAARQREDGPAVRLARGAVGAGRPLGGADRQLDAGTSESGSTWVRGYVWGGDYSNASGAAGGAGGLVAVNTSTADYLPVYDSMGNITGYLDASAGSVTAGCEYNAFGQVVATTGSWSSFAFGFATQFTDRETDLVYYGKRFYDPWQGRFINRDPIEEAGGLNLYSHTANAPTNRWDFLGLRFRFHFEGGGGWDFRVRISFRDLFRERGDRSHPSAEVAKAIHPVPVAILDVILSMAKADAFDGDALIPGASVTFLKSQSEVKTNGCGANDWIGKYIPDKPLLIVDFKKACDTHDRCYGTFGKSKEECDKVFLEDMMLQCLIKYGVKDKGFRGIRLGGELPPSATIPTGLPKGPSVPGGIPKLPLPNIDELLNRLDQDVELFKACEVLAKVYYDAVKKHGAIPYNNAQRRAKPPEA